MSSQRRIAASRRNGARSQGPKTAAGKHRSSENAIRHGLLAKRVVLENESKENFQILLNQYLEKFDPRDGVEFGMIEEMVASYWRLHRAFMIEKHLFDRALPNHDGAEPERLGEAWRELADSSALQSLQRYQSMMHRMHQRALNNFLLLRDMEPDDTERRNEPSPNSGHSETPAPPHAADRVTALPGSAQQPADPPEAATPAPEKPPSNSQPIAPNAPSPCEAAGIELPGSGKTLDSIAVHRRLSAANRNVPPGPRIMTNAGEPGPGA